MTNPFGLSKVKQVIAISSCKGGVGKSTVAQGLAIALAGQGFKVGLLDADIYGPSIPTLFNLHQVKIYANEFKMAVPLEAEGIKLMSFGFLLGDAPAVMRGPIVTRYVQELMLQTDWGELDFLLVDMPPGTGDVQLTITQTVRLSGAIIVTTPQALSLVDVARGILMFEKVGVPILGMVENMAFFVCDNCDKKHFPFGQGSEILEKRFGIKTLWQLPLVADRNLKPLMKEGAALFLKALEQRKNTPQEIPQVTVNGQMIHLKWSEKDQLTVHSRDVRLHCMCAQCVNEMTGQKMLDASKVKADIAPKEITPLGNYALSITWNDGHASGIYPYDLFRSLIGV